MRPFVGWPVGTAQLHRARLLAILRRCHVTQPSQQRSYSVTAPRLASQDDGYYLPPRRLMGMWLAPDANALVGPFPNTNLLVTGLIRDTEPALAMEGFAQDGS